MTNEQTALLLRHLASRFERALADVEAKFDGKLPRPVERMHVAPDCALNGIFCTNAQHYEERENPEAGRDELGALYSLLSEINDDAERLHPNS